MHTILYVSKLNKNIQYSIAVTNTVAISKIQH